MPELDDDLDRKVPRQRLRISKPKDIHEYLDDVLFAHNTENTSC